MTQRLFTGLTLLLVIPALLLTASCAKRTVTSEAPVTQITDDEAARLAAEKAKQEELERQRAIEEAKLRDDAATKAQMSEKKQFINEDIYFDFDSASLSPSSVSVLRKKADYLRRNQTASIIIEGHCDDRGTSEYNLALGDRRAESAKAYLLNAGISGNRLKTISYGEERPADTGNNESAWARNRRAHFVIE